MNQEQDMDILFIVLRENKFGHKDIDHYLPFLYFLNNNDKLKYKARGLIFDYKSNYIQSSDPRLKLLLNLENVSLKFLYNENFITKFFFKIKKFFLTKNNSKLNYFINNNLNKILFKLLEPKIKNINWKNNLGQNFLNSDTPVIITLHSNNYTKEIIKNIKKHKNKAKWIVVPHGTTICDNKMVLDSHLDKDETSLNNENFKDVDYFLHTSKRDLEDSISIGLPVEKGFVIGSPRYCEEWLQTKSNLNLDGKNVEKNNNKLRILFLTPKAHINIFHEELIRTIDFISSYSEMEITLLNYDLNYPKLPSYIKNKKNVSIYLISQVYSTTKLIDWSDIIFHAGSSVIFESFIKDKINVFPRYLTCNTLISQKYDAGFNLANRDELRNFCNKAIISLSDLKNNYKLRFDLKNKKFINDFVYSNSKSVKKNIIETISLIKNNFDNDKKG